MIHGKKEDEAYNTTTGIYIIKLKSVYILCLYNDAKKQFEKLEKFASYLIESGHCHQTGRRSSVFHIKEL